VSTGGVSTSVELSNGPGPRVRERFVTNPRSLTVHDLSRRQLPRTAVAGAVISVALLLAACAIAPAEVVRPGPPAAAAKAVSREALPVARSLPAPVATCLNAPSGWNARENRQLGVNDLPPSRTAPDIGRVGGYLDSFTAVCGQTMSVHLSAYGGPRVCVCAL
jgi:hypothetical protein